MTAVRRKFIGISVGDTFSCYSDLLRRIEMTEALSGVPISLRDCVPLRGSSKRTPTFAKMAKPSLLYYTVLYICTLGRPDSQRDKRYLRLGLSKDCLCKHGMKCRAEIKIGLTEDLQYLVVKRIIDIHNHKLSPELVDIAISGRTPAYQRHPGYDPERVTARKQRALSQRWERHRMKAEKSIKEIEERDNNIFDKYSKELDYKFSNIDSSSEEEARISDTKEEMHLEDLDRFTFEVKSEVSEDSLELNEPPKKISKRLGFKQLVEEMYNVEDSIVEVLQLGFKPQAIYFQTKEMRSIFALYPEVLVLDSCYYIPELEMKLYVIANGDGNGECGIVAFWFLSTENAKNIGFLVDSFLDNNPEWFNVKVVMFDREFPERKTILSRFSDSVTFTCYHHTVRSFQKEVYADEDVGFENEGERDTCMELLKKMALAKDLETYLVHFERFRLYVPASLYTSFISNWHNVKSQWVDGLKDPNAYFMCQTSCKMDSINELLESICINFHTVTKFFEDLMKTVRTMQLERKKRSIDIPIKGPLITTEFHIAEMRFRNLLTPYAFVFVEKQMYSSMTVKIKKNANNHACSVESAKYSALEVTASSCPCALFSVIGLPCSHIFAVRKEKGLPTYEPSLCSERWTMCYFRKSNDIFAEDGDLVLDGLCGGNLQGRTKSIFDSVVTSGKDEIAEHTDDVQSCTNSGNTTESVSGYNVEEEVITDGDSGFGNNYDGDVFVNKGHEFNC